MPITTFFTPHLFMIIKFTFFVLGWICFLKLIGMGYRQHFGKKHAKQKMCNDNKVV